MEAIYQYINTINSLGSFTKAAEQLHISQPALSMSVKKYEDEINQPIFVRNVKPLVLTPAGKILIAFIEELYFLESNTKAALEDIHEFKSCNIRIGASQYFIAFVLPDIIFDFTKYNPKAHITFIESSSDKLPGLLNDNKIDMIFSAKEFYDHEFNLHKGITDYLFIAIPNRFITNSSLEEYCLTRDEIISKAYEDLTAIPSLKPLENIPFITLREGNNLYERNRKLFYVENIKPPIEMYLDQLTTAHFTCKNGYAATLTTDILIRQINDDGNLLYLKYDHPVMVRHFNIVLKKKSYVSKILSAFIKVFNK